MNKLKYTYRKLLVIQDAIEIRAREHISLVRLLEAILATGIDDAYQECLEEVSENE